MGDISDGALKRVADSGLSWIEILMGKEKRRQYLLWGSGRTDILNRLEWTYNLEVERKLYGSDDMFDDESENQSLLVLMMEIMLILCIRKILVHGGSWTLILMSILFTVIITSSNVEYNKKN